MSGDLVLNGMELKVETNQRCVILLARLHWETVKNRKTFKDRKTFRQLPMGGLWRILCLAVR